MRELNKTFDVKKGQAEQASAVVKKPFLSKQEADDVFRGGAIKQQPASNNSPLYLKRELVGKILRLAREAKMTPTQLLQRAFVLKGE